METFAWILLALYAGFTLVIIALAFGAFLLDVWRAHAEERLPMQTVTAKVIGKRQSEWMFTRSGRRSHRYGSDSLYSSQIYRRGFFVDTIIDTHWYLTFQMQGDLRKEFEVTGCEYQRLQLQDRAELTFRGNRRIRLEPVAQKSWSFTGKE